MSTNTLLLIIIGLILYFLYKKYFQKGKNENNIETTDAEDDLNEDEINHLIIRNDEYGFTEMYLDGNKFYIYDRTEDYISQFNSTWEYKIDGEKIYQRILVDNIEHAGDKPYNQVLDGVVLESEIINRYKQLDEMTFSVFPIDEKIQSLKKQCDWNEQKSYEIRYFILSRNILNIGTEEVKKILRTDLEKIKLCVLKLEELCSRYDGSLSYNNQNPWFIIKGENSENEKLEFLKQLDIILKDMDFTRADIGDFEKRIETLNNYLNKL